MYDESKEKNYIFGYEESIGYNVGTFVRDKDGSFFCINEPLKWLLIIKQGKNFSWCSLWFIQRIWILQKKGIS